MVIKSYPKKSHLKMWPASRFLLRVRGGKRTLIHHCWSSAHSPDDASNDDFSACLKMHKDDRSNNWLYGYLRTKQTSRHWISLRCHTSLLPNKRGARAGESTDLTDPTTATSMKTSLKNRLRIIFNIFRDYPNSSCYLKEGDFGWSWREGNALKFGQRW